jgi:hypothetical protein
MGEKKGQGPKSRQANSPKEAADKEERDPLRTEPFTSHMNHFNKRERERERERER